VNGTQHNYEYEVDTSSGTASADVARMVAQTKRVLEMGCGPGSITKGRAQRGGCQVQALLGLPNGSSRRRTFIPGKETCPGFMQTFFRGKYGQ
jgi:hypothetical protein